MQRLSQLSKKALFGLTFLLLAFIPLYPKFPLFPVSGTFVAIRAEDILIALTFLVWILHLVLSKQLSILLKDNLIRAFGLFFFIGGLSVFSAFFITHNVALHLSVLHLLRRFEYMILLPIAFTAITSRKQLKWCLVLFFVVAALVALYAFGQKYLHLPVVSTTNSEFSKGLILYLTSGARVSSTFAGHYDLAIFLAMVLSAATGLFFLTKRIWIRFSILALSALSLTVLVMTAARVSFIAAVVGAVAYLILVGKRKIVLLIIVLTILILSYPSQLRDRLISTVTVNLEKQGTRYSGSTEAQKKRSDFNIPTLVTKQTSNFGSGFESTESGAAVDIVPGEPINTTELGVYRSFGIRFNYEWPAAIRAFTKNPFLGTGYSSLGIATDNDFLRSLGEVGFLGTSAFVLIIFIIVRRLWNQIKAGDKFIATNLKTTCVLAGGCRLLEHEVREQAAESRLKLEDTTGVSQWSFIKYISALGISTVITFLVNASFIDVFEASKVATLFWMFLGLCLSVVNLE